MDKELRAWTNDMISSMQHVADRINNNTLSDNDRNSFGVMLIQLEQAIKKEPEYAEDSSIITKLQESFNALMNNDAALMQQHQDEMQQIMIYGEVMITAEDRQSWKRFEPREDGRTYIDNLPNMQHDIFMQYVEHLKLIGAKFDPELKQWYVDADWQAPAKININEEPGNKINEKNDEEKGIKDMSKEKYKAVYYENSERKELFANTKDEAVDAVKNAKSDIKETDRCYIQELDEKSNSYIAEGTYLIASGRDVTPVEINIPNMNKESFEEVRKAIKEFGAKFNVDKKIWYIERSSAQETLKNIQDIINGHDTNTYLNLPYMSADTYKTVCEGLKEMGAKFNGDKKKWYIDYSVPQETSDNIKNFVAAHDEAIYLQLPSKNSKEQFNQMIQQLKRDGAKFNPDKRAWYITDKQDAGKFAAYLQSEKTSVLGKLEHNKEAAAKNNQENSAVKEPKNKETERD